MMRILEVAEQSFKTSWKHKSLWVFGLFVAGAGGSGSSAPGSAAGNAAQNPGWLIPFLVVAALVAIAGVVMHLLSEGALIRGVQRVRSGANIRIGETMREGFKTVPRVLGVKVLGAMVMGGVLAAIAIPAALRFAELLPTPAAILLTLPLLALGVPALITLSLAMEIALRIAVLDDKGSFEAWASARRYLSGRVLDSLQLFVLSALGQVGFALAGLAIAVPCAVVGVAVWALTSNVIAAIAVGAGIALPFIVMLVGALGTFRSSVWTHGFLNARQEEAA